MYLFHFNTQSITDYYRLSWFYLRNSLKVWTSVWRSLYLFDFGTQSKLFCLQDITNKSVLLSASLLQFYFSHDWNSAVFSMVLFSNRNRYKERYRWKRLPWQLICVINTSNDLLFICGFNNFMKVEQQRFFRPSDCD